jgi:hypothetical protein
LRRATGMQPLDPGAVGAPFDKARGLRAGDPQRIDEGVAADLHRGCSSRGGAEHAAQRGRMQAVIELAAAEHLTDAADDLIADEQRVQKGEPRGIRRLGCGKRRRHHHRAGMQHGDTVIVVQFERVREGAIGKRRIPGRGDTADRHHGRFRLAARRQDHARHRRARRRHRAGERHRQGVECVDFHAPLQRAVARGPCADGEVDKRFGDGGHGAGPRCWCTSWPRPVSATIAPSR